MRNTKEQIIETFYRALWRVQEERGKKRILAVIMAFVRGTSVIHLLSNPD